MVASKERALTQAGSVKAGAANNRAGNKAGRSRPRKGFMQSVLGKLSWSRIVKYFREVRAELKKVIWPGRKELMTYTLVVIVTVALVAAFIGLIDLAFSQILGLILGT